MPTLRSTRPVFLAACALLALGCSTTPAASDAGSGADAAPTPDAGGPQTIAAIATSSPDFSLLVAAATRAGLVSTLADEGATLTVFAPTDAAFAASGITRADIDAMPVAELTQLLAYHALPSEVPAAAVTAGPATTVADLSAPIGSSSPDVHLSLVELPAEPLEELP